MANDEPARGDISDADLADALLLINPQCADLDPYALWGDDDDDIFCSSPSPRDTAASPLGMHGAKPTDSG